MLLINPKPPRIKSGRLAVLVLLALPMLGGCVAVPGGAPLAAPLAPDGIAASQSLPAADAAWPAPEWPGARWWDSYGDPQLSALVDEALAHSPDVATAAARLRKAAAMAGAARSALLPTLDGQASIGLTRQSLNTGFPPQFIPYLPQGWNDEGNVSLAFGFDPDLWGRNRALLAAATSERQAAALDAQAAVLALASAVTSAYADLGAAMALRDLRLAVAQNRVQTASLIARRLDQGLERRDSLRLAQAGGDTARADLAAAEQLVTMRRHQLAMLVGAGPDRGLSITAPHLAPLSPRALPAGASTELIARRADVAAARARLEAAASRVGAAHASFFPAIKLSALYGLQALGLGQLLDTNSTYGTIGPAISLPIFHGGAIRAQYRGARADYDLALADYNRTVLGAYQQAADAVTARGALDAQNADVTAAVGATGEAYAIAQARYRGGLASFLDVLAAQDKMVQAQLAAGNLDAAARDADVRLIRALGGGYAPSPKDTKP